MKNSKLGSGWASVLAVVVGLAANPARSFAADDLRIGVVDMQKALQSVEAGKKAKAQLEKELGSKKSQIETEGNAIKKMAEEFKKQSLVMNDSARAKKQGELQERAMHFEELKMRTQQELQAKEGELIQPIIVKLRGVIQETAKNKKYNFILEKNENTVLYSQDKDDLTAEVISAFNKGQKG